MHYGAIKDFLNMKCSLNLFYDDLGVQKNYFGAGRGMCTHQAHFWKKPFPEKIGIFVKKVPETGQKKCVFWEILGVF